MRYTLRKTVAQAFADAKSEKRAAFITFTACGYKTKADTVEILLALQRGGADIIELGIPYSDPQADGPTIQRAHQVGVDQGITLRDVLATASEARAKGLSVPLVLMGYYNNFLQYGEAKICQDAHEGTVEARDAAAAAADNRAEEDPCACVSACYAAGVDGFIIVDLPPEEAQFLSSEAKKVGIAYIPLISPTTTESRMRLIASVAHGFVYCVSLTGVTGARSELPPNLAEFMQKSAFASVWLRCCCCCANAALLTT